MKTQKTILVIEDEKKLRKIIVDTLRYKKFKTLEAENGKDGVKTALSKHPHLILLDYIMPVMDGITAFKKIRKDAWGAHVPIIFLTNLTMTDKQLVEDTATSKSIRYFIKSDWSLLDVIKEVDKILKKQDNL